MGKNGQGELRKIRDGIRYCIAMLIKFILLKRMKKRSWTQKKAKRSSGTK